MQLISNIDCCGKWIDFAFDLPLLLERGVVTAATKLAFTCSMSAIETTEQCVRSVQSWQWKHMNNFIDIVLFFVFFLMLNINTFTMDVISKIK